jgi:taurine dioxygenase
MPELVPLKGPLGARIEGLDRARANEPAIAALLNRALAEHLLVVVPGERLTPAETRRFAEAFGRPQQQLLRYKHSGETPDVSIMVSTLMTDGTTDKTAIRAEDWHTDDSYFATPAKATLLHGIDIPSRGGSRNRPSPRTPREIAETPDVEHPLVRTHPETGRKALYLNPNRLDHIVGLERAESDALLDELADEARKPQHHFGHVWQVGDIVVWDNRATMHRVMIDYPVGEKRIMQRVLIEGDKPI